MINWNYYSIEYESKITVEIVLCRFRNIFNQHCARHSFYIGNGKPCQKATSFR